MSILIDAEFQALIPPLTAEERAQLEENLLAEGCRDPLVLWGDILVDGHNRHEICERHGLPFRTVEREFPDRSAARLWIARNQLGRRNLSDFARIELALLLKPDLAKAAESRMAAGVANPRQNSDEGGRTDDAVAALARSSRDSVRKVEKIKAAAKPEVIEQARAGEISIHAATKTIAPTPAPKQPATPPTSSPASTPPKPAATAKQVEELQDKLEELQDQVRTLLERNDELEEENKALLIAADPDALTKMKQYQERIRVLESQRNEFQTKANELTRECKRLRRQVEKQEKARA